MFVSIAYCVPLLVFVVELYAIERKMILKFKNLVLYSSCYVFRLPTAKHGGIFANVEHQTTRNYKYSTECVPYILPMCKLIENSAHKQKYQPEIKYLN
jgi:hypothetical protein